VPAIDHIALAPEGTRDWLGDAVEQGGATVVDTASADGLVWTAAADPVGLGALLDAGPQLRWIQLPWAGIEPYVDVVREHADRTWTCGKGVYAEPVAEHALALALAGLRQVGRYARAASWSRGTGVNLLGARVVILGGGGITESLLRLLEPFGCDTTVVRRSPAPMRGARRVVGEEELDEALRGATLVVLALALTPETRGILDRRRLDLLAADAWVVNVARGAHIVTDDLVAVLADGGIGGAALDVTDPEPLSPSDPLLGAPNLLVVPHIGSATHGTRKRMAELACDNLVAGLEGRPLPHCVNPGVT
jgi:phosphoglycerate dehydrogenase-like enzyme